MKRILWTLCVLFCFAVSLRAAEFSFLYDGQPQDLSRFQVQTRQEGEVVTETFTAPDGKLQIEVKTRKYADFPVRDWTIRLRNLSETESTGIVSDFQSLDLNVSVQGDAELRGFLGSTNRPEDFSAFRETLEAGKNRVFMNEGGRSSDPFFPFLELCVNDRNGFIFAPAWTGGWKAEFTNDGKNVNVKAGLIATNFRLLPSESVKLPGIAVFCREDQRRAAFQTLIHRFMLAHRVPRDREGKILPPITPITAGGGNKTPEMMQKVLDWAVQNALPFDTYWVDAGWYGPPHEDEHYTNCGPNWWKYVGDWRVNTTTHPTGDLKPISDAVHRAGMKFLLWFEPERVQINEIEVAPGVVWKNPILQEHPDFVNENLFDYGNPAALKWMQETIYGIIEKNGVDIYRQDFNTSPGGVWRKLDQKDPERVGIAEMKHIEGLYRFLDEMRERFPNIAQENCSSGGRRIDYEMISRAQVYCRSDYFIGRKPGDLAFIQGQNATRNTLAFLPFQGGEGNGVPIGDVYAMLSVFAPGTVCTPTDFDGALVKREFSADETHWFQKMYGLLDRIKPYWSADFYPLTEDATTSNAEWCAWQLDDPATDSGVVQVFRRAEAPDESRVLALQNIDPAGRYELENFAGEVKEVGGAELQKWTVTLPQRGAELIFYKKKK